MFRHPGAGSSSEGHTAPQGPHERSSSFGSYEAEVSHRMYQEAFDAARMERRQHRREESSRQKRGHEHSEHAPPYGEHSKHHLPHITLHDGERSVVTAKDRADHYSPQYDSFSCSTTAMANVYSFQHGGPPPTAKFERDAGRMLSSKDGWEGGAKGMVNMFQKEGLHAKDYTSGRVTDKTMADLNRELDQGHSAVIFVKNPHTRHGHFIGVYGRDKSGQYILGDPDSHNNAAFGHDRPVSADWVRKMMSGLDGSVSGFVAAWSDSKKR